MDISAALSSPLRRPPLPAPPGYWRLAAGHYSVLLHRRGLYSALFLCVLLLLCSGISLSVGSASLSVQQALLAAVGVGSKMQLFLIQELRLPRLLAAALTGIAFGVGGCLLQTLARNRLATPGVIGIDDGATAFAVASIVAVPTSLAPSYLALTGAATATALAFGLGGGAGARGYRFIVVGLGIGALFGAITQLMLARTDIDSANQAYPWTVGSLNARPDEPVLMLAVGLLLCLPLAKYLAGRLSVMRFNDAVASGLGVALVRTRVGVLLVTVVITALAVAVAGPVGLIALMAPEVARYLCGHQGVPVCNAGLAGALIMILADLAGRTVLAPIEIPVGVITAVVGGPYLLWILLRRPHRSGQ